MTQPTAKVSKLADSNDNPQIAERGAAVTAVAGTADGTYSSNEQTLINAQTTAINAIIERLEAHGLIADN